MSRTVIIVGKCVTNAVGGHLPVGKSFAKKILEHCVPGRFDQDFGWWTFRGHHLVWRQTSL